MRFFFSLAIVMMVALPAAAQPWYARGEFNGWTTDNQMVDQGGGHYTATISGLFANTDFEYKLAEEDYDPAAPGSNGKVRSNAAGEINFHLYDSTTWDDGWFPNDTRRVGYEDHDLFDWEIVGSFNDWPATNDPMYSLTDMGNGLHTGQFAFDAGTYQFKFRQQDPTNPWNTSIGNDFGNSAGNNFFTVTTDGDLWNFELDLPNGRWRTYTEAEPPTQPGDHNGDGYVDASDYVAWRKSPGDHGGEQGYDEWRANFGVVPAQVWYARGDFNGFNLDDQMVDQGGGHYTATVTGLTEGNDYEYKIADADFTESVPGSNGKVRADANGEVNFHFYELQSDSWSDGWSPTDKNRVGYEDHEQFDWELVGSFNGWPGTGDPTYYLTDQGNGLHTGTFTFATAGDYEFKFRQQGDWNTAIGDDFGNSAANNMFTVASDGESWTFELDLPNGRWRAYAAVGSSPVGGTVPEPASVALTMLAALVATGLVRRRASA